MFKGGRPVVGHPPARAARCQIVDVRWAKTTTLLE